MRVRVSLCRAGAVVSVVGCGVLGLSAQPAVAAAQQPAATSAVTAAGQSGPVNHFNVDAAHSPQLLRQLAGSSSAAGSSLAGGTNAGTMAPATSSLPVISDGLQGIDVADSQEQAGINWGNVYQAGIKFAAIKVTEGTYYINPYASADITAAKKAGLAVIGYAFANPAGDGGSASAVAQADFAIANAAGQHGNVPPIMLDIEYNPYGAECYGLSKSAMAAWISAFSNEVKAQTGRPAIVYTPQQWWSTCVGTQNAGVSSDQLWVPSYNTNTPPSPGTLPAGWPKGDWAFWQYTSTGRVNGITGYVDLDQANPALLTFLDPGNQQAASGASLKIRLRTSMDKTATPPSFSLASASGGSPPAGLSLSGATITEDGTTPDGAYPVTVTATDSAASPATATASFTIYVHGTLTVTPPASQSTAAGTPAKLRVSASDSPQAPPLTFTASGLPPGLSISSGGMISGWPDLTGKYHVTVAARDGWEAYNTASFTWTVTSAADRGPTGKVRLDVAGKCLNDVGNGSKNGTQTDIWSCNGSSAQRWTYAQDGTVRIHGVCLTAPGVAGWKVRLRPCNGGPSRQWLLAYPPSVNPSATTNALTLVNPASGLCLQDPGFSKHNGTRLLAASCTGFRNEEWTLPAGQVESQVARKCVYDNRDRKSNGNPVVLERCRNLSGERWTAEPDGTVRAFGKCLTVSHGSTSPGARVWLWHCFGGRDQRWQVVPDWFAGGFRATLVNPASGLCLTDPGNATRNGTRLRIETCTGIRGQGWRVQ